MHLFSFESTRAPSPRNSIPHESSDTRVDCAAGSVVKTRQPYKLHCLRRGSSLVIKRGKGVNSRLVAHRFSFPIDLNGLNGWNDLKIRWQVEKSSSQTWDAKFGRQANYPASGFRSHFLLMPTAYWEPAVFRREIFPKLKRQL